MSRPSLSTPCPAPPHSTSGIPRRLSIASLASDILQPRDDTAQLDYTRVIQQEFKTAKPRRLSKIHHRQKDAPVTIFEDVVEDVELVAEPRVGMIGSTLLSKPAQRMPRSNLRSVEWQENVQQKVQGAARTRMSVVAEVVSIADCVPEVRFKKPQMPREQNMLQGTSGNLKKEPRRRTIFVPPEDTSIMTIHPGAYGRDGLEDTFQLEGFPATHLGETSREYNPRVLRRNLRQPGIPSELGGTTVNFDVKHIKQPAQRARISPAAGPKLMPLQDKELTSTNSPGIDVVGQGGGKENLPPGGLGRTSEKKPSSSRPFESIAASQARQMAAQRYAHSLPVTRSAVATSTTVPPARSPRNMRPLSTRFLNFGPVSKISPKITTKQAFGDGSSTFKMLPLARLPGSHKSRLLQPNISRVQQYPILAENLERPELYEDQWLRHQEVALTEVINAIFSSTSPRTEVYQQGQGSLRERLVHIYHQPHVVLKHQRIQASLLYGAFSKPKDCTLPDPSQDLGLRKKFLSLWLNSYHEEHLRAAVEVVVGRQVGQQSPKQMGTSSPSSGSLDPHVSRRRLIAYLETFLVDVEDAGDRHAEVLSAGDTRWRKMVTRSLMLIWLLDQAKLSRNIQSCLFKVSSPRKSSHAMLRAIAERILPGVGDLVRALRHMDFDVTHSQDPLDEVNYHVDNLAVDMRNGVFLTRLAEVLIFSPSNLHIKDIPDDAAFTIFMPDGNTVESTIFDIEGAPSNRVLSSHLKIPCTGRAQKIYNVELALNAIKAYGRHELVVGLDAEDVVDGHREKTLSLIWALVSNYGLGQLVDFAVLIEDIKRTSQASSDACSSPIDKCYLSQLEQENLLMSWSVAHCARQGLDIANLTTSFADGTAYTSIVNAFSAYVIVTGDQPAESRTPNRHNLELQLASLGCSSAFTKQLTSAHSSIPCRQTTLSNLAFLASRLLPLTRTHHAVVMIQRAYRHKNCRVIASQRIRLMRVAHAAAKVVQTRNRIVAAAIVLQRRWRSILHGRVARLSRRVVVFQVVARKWLLRRQLAGSAAVAQHSRSLRVMGGW